MPNLRSPNSKCQTTIKGPNTEKAQIEFFHKPNEYKKSNFKNPI
jgi:hypothetical protein